MLRALANNFDLVTSEWRVQLFRALFGLGCLWKFVETFRHGGWRRFDPETFNRYQLVRRRGLLGKRVAQSYKFAVVIRCLPALGVALGFWTDACLILVIVFLAVELVYEPRQHPVYFIVNAVYLLLAADPGSLLRLDFTQTTANTWAQCLIAVTTLHLYWNSAWMKLRSRQFRSGKVLAQVVHVSEQVRDTVKYQEYCLPAWAWRPFSRGREVDVRRWRLVAISSIVVELLMPVGLLFRPTYLVFFVLGAGMHVVFTFLKPRGLIPFSLITVASYLAFAR